MEVINFDKVNSILNQFIAELRDVNVQKDQMRFRRNMERIGEIMALEVSKRLNYVTKDIQTPLGISTINVPEEDIVLATVFRAGLPFHKVSITILTIVKTPLYQHIVNILMRLILIFTLNIWHHRNWTVKPLSWWTQCWQQEAACFWLTVPFCSRVLPPVFIWQLQ